jgi:tRNA A-37 threonylcarbamoyl transferase component Bud32
LQKSLSLLRHPIIDALFAGAWPDDVRCSYTEHSEKGYLEDFWKAELGPERLSLFRRRIQIALDVMTAIRFLHVGNDEIASCCHGDISSANILLKRDFTAQLINCGLSKVVIDSQLDTGVNG